jgi:hypothetical protein
MLCFVRYLRSTFIVVMQETMLCIIQVGVQFEESDVSTFTNFRFWKVWFPKKMKRLLMNLRLRSSGL